MPTVKWSPDAEKDLDGIFDYITEAEHRPSTAAKLIREIDGKCRLRAYQPLAATRRDDLGEGLHTFPHKCYIIVYRPLDDGIEVLRVLDGARDYPRLFS